MGKPASVLQYSKADDDSMLDLTQNAILVLRAALWNPSLSASGVNPG